MAKVGYIAPHTKREIAQAAIADIDASVVDTTYGQEEADVLTDLQTKTQSILDALRAAGIIAE